MIRRLLARLIPGRTTREPKIYRADQHAGSPRTGPARRACMVTEKLHEAGFKAFVVGGAVRDLLLGLTPKDFDIATNATPEQVKPLFRRAFIIGRRFRLVHVHVGAEVLEVSTFRAAQTGDDATDEHGRLLSDNVYGSQAQDAARRDFTINALVFRSGERGDLGLRRRRARRARAAVAADRTAGHALPRGPGADAARRPASPRKSAWRSTPRPRPRSPGWPASCRTCPPARLFDEMQKLLLSGHAVETLREPARARTLARTPAAPRRHPRAAARPEVHRRRARRNRPRACAKAGRVAGVPVRHAAVARGAADVERGEGARREAASGVVRRDGSRAGAAGATDIDPAPLRSARSRRSGRCSRASSSAPDRARIGCSSIRAFAPPTIFSSCAASRARCRARSSTGGRNSRTRAMPEREAMLKPDEAPKKRRRSRGRGRKHREDALAAGRHARRGTGGQRMQRPRRGDRGVRRAGQQPRSPAQADCRRHRRDRPPAANADRGAFPNYATAPVACDDRRSRIT